MDVKLQIVLIFGMIANISGWRPFIVTIQNETFESFHPEIIDLNLTIKNKSLINANVTVVRDITQLFMDLEVARDSGDGLYDMAYMNKTVELCFFLNNRKSNALLDIVYRIVSAHGDLPKRCPLHKRLYKLRNVPVDPEQYPPFFPDHKVRASAIVWDKEKDKMRILGVISIYVVIERSFKNNANQ